MKLFNVLPLAFVVVVQAIPNPSLISASFPFTKKSLKVQLGSVGVSVKSPLNKVVHKLGLDPNEDDLESLLAGLFGDSSGTLPSGLLDDVESTLDSLLGSLGLGGLGGDGDPLDSTISEVESALGLSGTSSLEGLLNSLGLLQGTGL